MIYSLKFKDTSIPLLLNGRFTGVVVPKTAIDGASICCPCAISLALFLKYQKLSIEAEFQLHQE